MIVTIDQFKMFNNIDPTDTDKDDLITMFLTSAQTTVEDYLQYTLDYGKHKFLLSGENKYYISLPTHFIHTVFSIKINGVEENVANYFVRDNFIIRTDKTNVFAYGINNIEVVIDYGYPTVSEPIIETPSILTSIILQISSLLWAEKDGNIGVTSKTLDNGGSRVFYKTTNFDSYLNKLNNKVIYFIPDYIKLDSE